MGYRKLRHRSGESYIVASNPLQHQFNSELATESLVTDIAHKCAFEG